jgi:hypothetical protein
MSPEDLPVGGHVLRCEVTADGQVVFDNSIQFTVDAPGGGACAE